MGVENKQQVIRLVEDHHQVLQQLGVNRFGLCGSFRRDEMTKVSDVDVLVIFQPGMKTFANFMDLCFFLEELFGRKVDLLTPESLSPYLKDKILAEVEYVSFP
ncbi:nucleotidyltransferase family protein [Alkalinema sp. FACHB-956]|uniref:nucleotidyltransferase family protein n=1 Tax=Alkalinema sp. FACHB-956 TaxID=2692768 RepID=UPI001686F6D6|nr:nucleotidyltransferase family protein [Alkalinema sp. FACHB-956]MBD2329549.1 nucleotidyltransferase family protein [Alkalinema sp. FACHB-956]